MTIDGRRVAALFLRTQTQDRRSATWNGQSTDGREMPSGVYLALIRRKGRINGMTRLTLLR